jgi:hypothetical protein
MSVGITLEKMSEQPFNESIFLGNDMDYLKSFDVNVSTSGIALSWESFRNTLYRRNFIPLSSLLLKFLIMTCIGDKMLPRRSNNKGQTL